MTTIDLNNRNFKAIENSASGQVGGETIFSYHQSADQIWAHYSGGKIVNGTLCGHFISSHEIDFRYGHWDVDRNYLTGRCTSKISIPEGSKKLNLFEQWQWDHNLVKGTSRLIEI